MSSQPHRIATLPRPHCAAFRPGPISMPRARAACHRRVLEGPTCEALTCLAWRSSDPDLHAYQNDSCDIAAVAVHLTSAALMCPSAVAAGPRAISDATALAYRTLAYAIGSALSFFAAPTWHTLWQNAPVWRAATVIALEVRHRVSLRARGALGAPSEIAIGTAHAHVDIATNL